MLGHQDLANRIRQMREAGDSVDEIASALDASWEFIRSIIRKFETAEVLSARSNRFLENIRKADDLEKKWKVGYLAQGIRPKVITQNAIIHHFKWAKIAEISLRELMDVTISEQVHPKAGYLITPVLDFRCIGVEGFWSLVSRLTESDLGERCNEEWRKRLTRLNKASRIVGGGRYSWSKPAGPPPRLSKQKASTAMPGFGV